MQAPDATTQADTAHRPPPPADAPVAVLQVSSTAPLAPAVPLAATYRAWVCSKPGTAENLSLQEVPHAALQKGQVRVKILYAGIGLTDLYVVNGTYVYSSLPATPGYELLGEVVEVAADAHSDIFTLGRRVIALCVTGGWAEYAAVDHDDLVPVPHFLQDRLPDAQVIPIVLNYATAYQMLHREALTHNALGKKVFATGLSGGIGLALLDLAKHMDMTIYGTASASKHELVRAAGGIPIDYKKDNVEEYVSKAEPEGVDFAFDALGANWSKMSWRLLRKGGKLITFGVTATTSAIGGFGAFILPSLLGMLPGGSGTFYGITALYKKNKNLFKNDLVVLLEMLADKKINPLVDSVIPLAEAKTGLAKLVNGDVQGKIVIKVAE